ncbi:hypothetical protein OCA14_15840 [Bacillus cereus]|nr:hypothetical protein [Bacillus cereus]MCU5100999.1 hypothetical protein [Bacillus cereus]MCU5346264.1 hypothetical protein [Bacillus cereus]
MFSSNSECKTQVEIALPAFGFAFNATEPQSAALFAPLFLPSTNSNPDLNVPVINDTINTGTGIQIQKTGIYQINYSLTISLDNDPAAPEGARFFLALNSPTNLIPGSGTAVRSNVIGTGEVTVSSSAILINLNPGNLIQIVPAELIGTVDIRSAALTVAQIA